MLENKNKLSCMKEKRSKELTGNTLTDVLNNKLMMALWEKLVMIMLPAAQNAEPLIEQSKNLKKTTSVLHWDTGFTKMRCSSFELKWHILLIFSVLVLMVLFCHVCRIYCCTTTFKSFNVHVFHLSLHQCVPSQTFLLCLLLFWDLL